MPNERNDLQQIEQRLFDLYVVLVCTKDQFIASDDQIIAGRVSDATAQAAALLAMVKNFNADRGMVK